jgi:hypothetical protein
MKHLHWTPTTTTELGKGLQQTLMTAMAQDMKV